MDAKQLQFFKRTAELEHMTKAAAELQVSQPFLSKSIVDLEEEMGVKLFDRIGRGIVLNEYGKSFYRHVVEVFNQLEDARNELADLSDKSSSKITITTNVGMYLPGMLGRLAKTEPNIQVMQYSARRRRMISMLREGVADYALCCPPIEEPDMETRIMMREFAALVYPPGHWLQDYKTIRLSDLKDEKIISVARGYGVRDATDIYFEQAGISPNIVVESTDTSSILNYVKNGLGIALAPLTMVRLDPFFYKNHTASLEPPLTANVGLTKLSGRYLSRTNQIFADTAREYFRELEKDR